MTLIEWLERYRELKASAPEAGTADTQIGTLMRHLKVYSIICTRARLSAIDRDFCEGFVRYLAQTVSMKDGHTRLSAKTQHHYFILLRAALNTAVREGLLWSNPINLVRRELRVRVGESQRVFLDAGELQRLLVTPFHARETRRAFLFSCFTGLRISDIRRLTWRQLSPSTDCHGRQTMRLNIVMKKTGRMLSFNLPQEALKQLPERGEAPAAASVFHLPSAVSLNRQVKQWAAQADITKRLCFHSARHTFATTAITLGADIYTVSRLLGHTNVATTQIYARIIDKKKDEALHLFDEFFGET